ncbi:GNAT family N-acetyltransferase [Rickettsiales endosymbiont of Stachyamoeba lipophora]|uniref:GNAT family N-acetyltransferase n=1 Tax=Rickettsiales endosymbiont of Stachyamoeba lipophora TaxID=2486578 RepID=UPI0013DDF627|nr:GNAT family N-acetyltransferase [Rickettsiales endosymbiont of Stachyamoeba lipophora]
MNLPDYILTDKEVICFFPDFVRSQTVLSKLNSFIDHQNRYGFSDWAVFEKSSGQFIARAGPMYLTKPSCEIKIGYVINKDYCGKGYATELLEA